MYQTLLHRHTAIKFTVMTTIASHFYTWISNRNIASPANLDTKDGIHKSVVSKKK